MLANQKFGAVVIGGGPAGAATAHALARSMPSGSRICVIERAPEMASDKPRGAGISVVANGQRALAGIDPALLAKLRAMGGTYTPPTSAATPAPSMNSWDAPRVTVGWHELTQLLNQTLPDVGVEVHMGCKFVNYSVSEDGSGLHVTLEDNSAQVVQLDTGLLVGADGFYSPVRQCCLADGPPNFVGTVFWRARVGEKLAHSKGFTDLTYSFSGQKRLGLLFQIAGGDYVWTLSCTVEELKRLGIDYEDIITARRQEAASQSSDYLARSKALGDAALARVKLAFEGVYEQRLLDLIAATDAASIVEHGLYVRSAAECNEEWFGRGRVVILGDAAHPVRPTGQGTNLAFEDAYELGRCITQGGEGDLLKSLDTFRQRRSLRVGPVMTQAEVLGGSAYTVDGVRTPVNPPFKDATDYQAFMDSAVFLPVLGSPVGIPAHG